MICRSRDVSVSNLPLIDGALRALSAVKGVGIKGVANGVQQVLVAKRLL
jgi:hypothetical protein